MFGRGSPDRSGERLQAAVPEWQDGILGNVAGMVGREAGTIHRWLYRMEREGPEGRHDDRSPGRPPYPVPAACAA